MPCDAAAGDEETTAMLPQHSPGFMGYAVEIEDLFVWCNRLFFFSSRCLGLRVGKSRFRHRHGGVDPEYELVQAGEIAGSVASQFIPDA